MSKKIMEYYIATAIISRYEGECEPSLPVINMPNGDTLCLPYSVYDPNNKNGMQEYFKEMIQTVEKLQDGDR